MQNKSRYFFAYCARIYNYEKEKDLTLLTLPAPIVFKMSHNRMIHTEKSWGQKGQKGHVFFLYSINGRARK
jgi:hypothetical protein